MGQVKVLTPAGRGAVATVRIDPTASLNEPTPLFVAENGRPLTEQPIGRVCFGRWGRHLPEPVVVCHVEADAVEIHCHGGEAAVSRIVDDLLARGFIRHDRQAEDVPPLNWIEAECREALTRATTLRTADLLWQQCQGRLSNAIAALEESPPETRRQSAERLLRWAEFGRHLTQPWQVVLCGRPNVGKSSLINALAGYARSVVFDQPGTTRDVVTVETAFEGWLVALSDTAGLREAADALEASGIQRAHRRLQTADLRLLLVDTSRTPDAEDHRLLSRWPDALLVAHKSDLPDQWGPALPSTALPVSSLTGMGVDRLAKAMMSRLVPETPPPMTLMPVTARQVAAVSDHRNPEPAPG